METADVVVIGGGVMGTSIAFNLARRRAGRVVLLEKNTVCSGTSAKSSAIVRTHYTTRPTAQMALLARGIFERWADEVGGECGFVRTGMLFIGPPESRDRVERTLRMNQEVGIEASLIGPDDVAPDQPAPPGPRRLGRGVRAPLGLRQPPRGRIQLRPPLHGARRRAAAVDPGHRASTPGAGGSAA